MGMNVTPRAQAAPPSRPSPPSQPAPEAKSRFDEALQRKEKGASKEGEPLKTDNGAVAVSVAQSPLGQLSGFDFDQGQQRGGSPAEAVDEARGGTVNIPAPTAAFDNIAAITAFANSQATLSPGFAEMAARIDLPAATSGSETHLTMTDNRWIASHAVVTRDDAGALQVDVEARSGEDQDDASKTLRERLEARGHKVGGIRFTDAPAATTQAEKALDRFPTDRVIG